MVKIELDVDPSVLFLNPHQAIQQFSLKVLTERQALVDKMKGMEWNNSTTRGRVVECSHNILVVELPDKKRQELPLTGGRLRQLLQAVTTRK